MRDYGTGMFTPQLANEVDEIAKVDLQQAKKRAMEIANSSTANSENLKKAELMISKARTRVELLDSIWRGFMLAHSGMKVLR